MNFKVRKLIFGVGSYLIKPQLSQPVHGQFSKKGENRPALMCIWGGAFDNDTHFQVEGVAEDSFSVKTIYWIQGSWTLVIFCRHFVSVYTFVF